MRLLLWTLLGTGLAALLAPLPALHIYNVAGLFLLGSALEAHIPPEPLAYLFLGLVAGYAMFNSIPAIFLSAPDESSQFLVLPGQQYLLRGEGFKALLLTNLGGLGGLLALLLLAPVAPRALAAVRAILSPHLGWLLWAIIAYLLLSEWPKGTARAPAGWRRCWQGWRSLLVGWATFLLSGLLGLLLMYRPLLPVEVAYQHLLPAFIGLFALPWVLQNLWSRTTLPPQRITRSVDAPAGMILQGVAAGVSGGLFAAFFPVVTGGIGSLLAGQAIAQRDGRAFLISQGAAKVVYYVGGLWLFFVPGLHLTRGGLAWMLSTRYRSYTPESYYRVTAALLLAGVVAFFLSLGVARGVIAFTARAGYRAVNWLTLALLLGLVFAITGPGGLVVAAIATAIGLLPPLWGARRLNAMGVLLLPLGLSMIGLGDEVARWLQLW